jgi:predicted lipoprotein with Yx(FWY)xxD motif
MDVGRKAILAIATMAVLALGVAACGSSNDNSDNASAATGSGSTGGGTVSTKSVSGVGDVLVDSKGAALYTNDMDTASKVACTDQCLTEWVPLAAQGTPSSSDSAVQAKLGTMKRPDGGSQVTYKGIPLYTFVEDSSGQVTGNGFTDSFAGTTFTWTAATTGGTSSGASGTTTSSSSGATGYGGGGY